MNLIDSKKSVWILTWLLLGSTSIYIFSQGPTFGGDSYGYLRMDLIRPIGYPLFLYLMRIFGDYQEVAVMIFQILLNIGAAAYFLKRINSLFKLAPLYNLLLLPLLLYTIIYFARPDALLSEAITFPLFLIVSIYVIESILTLNTRPLYKAVLLNTLIFLIREQFLFLFPLIGLLYIYIQFFYQSHQERFKKSAIFIGTIALCLIGASTLNKTYHYVVHDTFSNPHMNVSFFPTAIYAADLNDSDMFDDPEIRSAYREIYQSIDASGLTMNHFQKNIFNETSPSERRRSDLIQHYHESFEGIQNIVRDYYGTDDRPLAEINQNVLEMDDEIKTMTTELIKSHLGMFLYLNISDILVYAFNNDRGYAILFFLLTLISFWGLVKRNQYGIILFFFMIGHVLNLLASSLSIKIIPRYTFYMTFMISIVLMISLIKFFLERENSPDKLTYK